MLNCRGHCFPCQTNLVNVQIVCSRTSEPGWYYLLARLELFAAFGWKIACLLGNNTSKYHRKSYTLAQRWMVFFLTDLYHGKGKQPVWILQMVLPFVSPTRSCLNNGGEFRSFFFKIRKGLDVITLRYFFTYSEASRRDPFSPRPSQLELWGENVENRPRSRNAQSSSSDIKLRCQAQISSPDFKPRCQAQILSPDTKPRCQAQMSQAFKLIFQARIPTIPPQSRVICHWLGYLFSKPKVLNVRRSHSGGSQLQSSLLEFFLSSGSNKCPDSNSTVLIPLLQPITRAEGFAFPTFASKPSGGIVG